MLNLSWLVDLLIVVVSWAQQTEFMTQPKQWKVIVVSSYIPIKKRVKFTFFHPAHPQQHNNNPHNHHHWHLITTIMMSSFTSIINQQASERECLSSSLVDDDVVVVVNVNSQLSMKNNNEKIKAPSHVSS